MSDTTPHPYDRITDIGGFVVTMGRAIHKSGFFKCVNEEQGQVIALDCLVRKVTPLERAQTDHIVDGKLSMRSDAMLAKFVERGGKVKWLNQGDDGVEARAKWTASDGTSIEIKYSMEDAKRTGCVKPGSGYAKDPGAQLRARLISKAVRMLDAAVVAGRYTPEELGEDADLSSSVPVANEENHKPLNLPATTAATAPAKVDAPAVTTPTQPTPVVESPQVTAPVTQPTTTASTVTTAAPVIDTASAAPPTQIRGSLTQQQIHRLGELKKALAIPDDKWKVAIAKRGVTEALLLSQEQAAELIAGMEKRLNDREMNAFADRVVNGGSAQSAPANAEQPPFDAPA